MAWWADFICNSDPIQARAPLRRHFDGLRQAANLRNAANVQYTWQTEGTTEQSMAAKWPTGIWRMSLAAALIAALLLSRAPAARLWAQEPPVPPATPPATAEAAVSDRLAAQLAASDGPVNFLVILASQAETRALALAATGTTQERAATVYRLLTANAEATQGELRAWLTGQGVPFRPFYIVNMIEVTGDAALAQALARRSDVARLAANPPVAALNVIAAPGARLWREPWRGLAGAAQELPWGLTYTGAPEVWAQGIQGAGIVFGSQDTGVQWDHPALQPAYRGWNGISADHPYDWFDAFGVDFIRAQNCAGDAATDAQIPCDDYGHGTHTVGTMLGDASAVGGTLLGMAPDAQWIGCRNMTAGIGTPASYAACFQFFLAPYPQNGDPFTDGKPELAPHIINNSWSCPPSEGCDDPNILRRVIETSRAAGQFVAASAGNEGTAGCSSIDNPIALYDDVFTVGSHGYGGSLSYFSSRGPVTIDGSNRLKPDLVAPGEGVYSTWVNNGYTYLQGTSMASPHVAGAVALLWSAFPELVGDIDATEQLLREAATPVPSSRCGDGTSVTPNAEYGYGRLNVAAAVQMIQDAPSLTVTVVSTALLPLPGILVEVHDLTAGTVYGVVTNEKGIAFFPRIYTQEWEGARTVTFLSDTKASPLILVDAPVRLLIPMWQGSLQDLVDGSR